MEKGFTLKSFLIALTIIILMVLIAFFVQRGTSDENEIEMIEESEDYNYEENEDYSYEEEEEEEVNNYEENNEIIEEEESEEEIIIDLDCGEAEYLVNRAKEDLSLRIGVSKNNIKTLSCQENIFSDHTLGTSGPGEIYNQQPTKGYVIILSHNDSEYRYHGNENNLFLIN